MPAASWKHVYVSCSNGQKKSQNHAARRQVRRRGVGGTVDSESARRFAGTLLWKNPTEASGIETLDLQIRSTVFTNVPQAA
ncbi:hypothetical protein PoB_001850900 [Plakobranchus ocellatus]|uniref:Uncharacterized protein n=1 Tax=Plakobranchus ocellatus TaxID=259542 RepID=A0AAV3ZDP0_9GAST|nr:hypothetical protein PoB_001850900 [Plakobranchus ocellatus]